MAEHDWEELFVKRERETVYAGLDRCRNCRTLRSTVTRPYWYMKPSWISRIEPDCEEAS